MKMILRVGPPFSRERDNSKPVLHDFAMTWPQVAMRILRMHWTKQLAYTITPKSGPMRRMETLLDEPSRTIFPGSSLNVTTGSGSKAIEATFGS